MPRSQQLPDWLATADLLPTDSLPTKLSGRLQGRPGIANWLGQDLLLKTPLGTMKLHFSSVLGPLGTRLSRAPAVTTLIGESVQVLGWFRRGNHPWIDIDKIRLSNGTFVSAAHPLFSLLIAGGVIGWGIWLLMVTV